MSSVAGEAITARVRFLDSEGNPLELSIDQHGAADEVTVNIPARGSRFIETVGSDLLKSGWAVVEATGPVRASAVFRAEIGGLTFEAGIDDVTPAGTFTVPVQDSQDQKTAIAFANPSDEEAVVDFQLIDRDGNELASAERTVSAHGHAAQFVEELFSDFQSQDLSATVVVKCTVPIVAAALRTENGLQTSSYPVGRAIR